MSADVGCESFAVFCADCCWGCGSISDQDEAYEIANQHNEENHS